MNSLVRNTINIIDYSSVRNANLETQFISASHQQYTKLKIHKPSENCNSKHKIENLWKYEIQCNVTVIYIIDKAKFISQ